MGRERSGSIRKLPSGRWQARYWTLDGRRVAARRTFATKTDARLWLSGVMVDESHGARVVNATAAATLGEYAGAWLKDRGGVSPRTREIYEGQLRLHILPRVDPDLPALGNVALVDLSPSLIRSWYGALERSHSHATAAKAYVRLRQILRHAVDEDLLVKNPCRIERGGAERHPEQRFASLEDLYRIAAAVPERYRCLILLAGLCGLRQGELFGLRRADVDLAAGTVTVRRKRLRLASGVTIEDDPKSAAGRRVVSIPPTLMPEISGHLRRFAGPATGDYVFTSAAGKPLERNNFRGRVWLPALAAAGMEHLRFHDLRHTAGTLAEVR